MDHCYIDEHLLADRYLDHVLEPQERSEFEAHLVDCLECRDRLLLAEMFHARNGVAKPAPNHDGGKPAEKAAPEPAIVPTIVESTIVESTIVESTIVESTSVTLAEVPTAEEASPPETPPVRPAAKLRPWGMALFFAAAILASVLLLLVVAALWWTIHHR